MATFICLLLNSALVAAHVITPRAALPTSYPGQDLFRRAVDTCDDYSDGFRCNVGGTCYTGSNGWIGCCSTTSCYARTTCIDYQANPTTSCDRNYGGCLQCTDDTLPSCYTITNTIADQFIFYCNAVAGTSTGGWTNGLTDGSLASAPPVTTSSTSSSSSSNSTPTSSTTGSTTAAAPSSTASSVPSPTRSSTSPTSSASTNGTAPAPTNDNPSTGAIIGIAVGSTAGVVVILLAVAYCLRRRLAALFSKKKKKNNTSPYTGQNPTENFEVQQVEPYDGSTAAASIETKPSPKQDDGSARHIMDSSARYTVTNPDAHPPIIAEAPGSRPSLQISPMTNTFTSPRSSATNGWPSPMSSRPASSQVLPYTPSQYRQEPPDSVQQPQQQPPSLPQHYSAATFQAYSPSNNRSGAAQQPSSLPQDFSTASLVSDTSSRRNLSSWPYLSAEDALTGGWVNGRESPEERRGQL